MQWDKHFTDFRGSDSDVGQKRRLGRLLFFSYTLMFNVYDTCGYPFHVLIADLVDSFSGSETLMNLLCKLGVTVSRSTHKRFIQNVVTCTEKAGGMVSKLVKGAFTIASVDNLDKLFSKKVVRTGDTVRCWNGTTVNGYNPKPKSLNQDSVMTETNTDEINEQIIIPNEIPQARAKF